MLVAVCLSVWSPCVDTISIVEEQIKATEDGIEKALCRVIKLIFLLRNFPNGFDIPNDNRADAGRTLIGWSNLYTYTNNHRCTYVNVQLKNFLFKASEKPHVFISCANELSAARLPSRAADGCDYALKPLRLFARCKHEPRCFKSPSASSERTSAVSPLSS